MAFVNRYGIHHVFKAVHIIGLNFEQMLLNNARRKLGKLLAAIVPNQIVLNHHFKANRRNDYVITRQKFQRGFLRQNFIAGKGCVFFQSKKAAVVTKPNDRVRSILPNLIERGDFVQINI